MALIDQTQDPAVPVTESRALRKNALGTGAIFFMVISAAAPLTIVAGIAPLAILIGGIGAPAVYIIAGLVLGIFAIAFMAMTKHVQALGGFYTYITIGLGKAVGLASSFLALVSYNALQIGLYGLLGVSCVGLFASFGISIPWWAAAFVAIAAVYLVAWRGVDVGAKVLAVLLMAETAILLVFSVVVLFQGGADGISFGSFSADAILNPGLIAILGFGFAAFMGFESTALYREEARNPNRTIPRATYLSVAFMAVFYGFVIWAVIVAAGEANVQAMAAENTASLVFDLVGAYLGPVAETLTYVLIITSVYAAQLAFHNAINRYTYSLARDGVLPKMLQRTGAKTGSPYASGLLQTALAVLVVGLFAVFNGDPYMQLLIWVNSPGVYGILILQVLTCIAVVVYFVRRPQIARKWYVVPAAIVAGVLMTAVIGLLVYFIEFLTGSGPVVNTIIIAVVPVPFIVGLVLAARWKRTRPAVYAQIGGSGNEDALGVAATEPSDA